MDPVSIIVAALTAGAVAGAQNTATAAVKDGYDGLRSMLRAKLANRAPATAALTRHEEAPEQSQEVLRGELINAGVGQDPHVVDAAKRLLGLLGASGAGRGSYIVDAHGSQGVQYGDGNTQTNSFGSPPA